MDTILSRTPAVLVAAVEKNRKTKSRTSKHMNGPRGHIKPKQKKQKQKKIVFKS